LEDVAMSEPNAAPAPLSTNRTGVIFLAISAMLIGTFLYRVLVPAHEYALRSDQLLTMGIDLLLIVGLVSMKGRVQMAGGTLLF
jgi:hypothetical protein